MILSVSCSVICSVLPQRR